MNNLAIVIPAYKGIFLAQVLESIVDQTDRNFTVYIGDDCSSDNLSGIVQKYEDKIPICYKRFDTNIGGKDLVAQWQRCIELTQDEEWIWLFSDDDLMSPNCVEGFYSTINTYPNFDIYHFQIVQIDEQTNPIGNFYLNSEVLSIEELIMRRLQRSINSCVVDYVFRKSMFISNGGFVNFDLAWCSDDATWIKLGRQKGIRNIECGIVYWRQSQYNISSIIWDNEIIQRKLNSQIEFIRWLYSFKYKFRINIDSQALRRCSIKWFLESIKYSIANISYNMINELISRFYHVIDNQRFHSRHVLFFYCYKSLSIILEQRKKVFKIINL